MAVAVLQFLPDLERFLSSRPRDGRLEISFAPHQTRKHLIEALGVPHTEIGEVIINGVPASLAEPLHDGETAQIAPPAPGTNQPPDPLRFVLDVHLGRLAAALRMLGFDTLYQNDSTDPTLAEIAAQGRILVTRDRRLLMRKSVQYGYCPRSLEPEQQLTEVVRRYKLVGRGATFQRCLRCNAPLERVDKQDILNQLQPLTSRYYDTFHRCPSCGQIYWPGSHYERMLARIRNLQD